MGGKNKMSFMINIKMKFKAMTNNDLKGASVDISSKKDEIYIKGQVHNFKQLDLMEQMVEKEAPDKKINNELKIEGNKAEEKLLKVRARIDDVITSKLNDMLENKNNELEINFKVYDGKVVITGKVSSEKDARDIEESIWQLKEVKDVVNILEY